MKFTPSVVIDAPGYYVDHFNGRCDTDKVVIMRNLELETDFEAMKPSLKHLSRPTNILDLTNNQLIVFPNLSNRSDIHTLLLGRNRIAHLDGSQLPTSIENLVLAHNSIDSYEQLEGLKNSPKSLKNLILRGNQICHIEGYSSYVVKLLPQLEVLDLTKISKEMKEAAQFMVVPILQEPMSVLKGISVGSGKADDKSLDLMNLVVNKMTKERRNELKLQLANASSLEEIDKIEKLLSGGI